MKLFLLGVLLAFIIAIFYIVLYLITRKDRLRSLYLTVLCFAVGMYLLGYLFELLSPTLEAAMIANKLQNLGIPLIAPLFLLFILSISRAGTVKSWMLVAALVYGQIFFLIVLLNEQHLLYYPTVERLPVWDFHYLLLGHGPLYYLHSGMATLLSVGAYTVLIVRMRKWNARMRGQMRWIVAGSFVAFAAHLLYVTRAIAHYIDPTPFAMSVTVILSTAAIAKNRMFDITGIALESAIRSMDDAVVIVDVHWALQSANESATRLFPEIAGMPVGESVTLTPGWPGNLHPEMPSERVDFTLNDPAGQKRYFQAYASPVLSNAHVVGWSIVMRDTTDMEQLIEQMHRLAVTDPLTGIFNRRYFMDVANRRLHMSKRENIVSALVLFDIDHFKVINDTFGHEAGDLVLQRIARAVGGEMRDYDIFARYGGEEFIVFIYNINGDDALNFAERLRGMIRDIELVQDGRRVEIAASFGVVELYWDSELDHAIRAADKAMYLAKQSGRDCVKMGRTGARVRSGSQACGR